MKRVYRNGRDAFAVAQDDPSQEHLHEWRKQVKYLWHQLQVLQPIQLGQLTALADQAHALADALGDDHDLAVLSHKFLEEPDRFPDRATMHTLADLIARRRALLQEQAMTLGHLSTKRNRAYLWTVSGSTGVPGMAKPKATPSGS